MAAASRGKSQGEDLSDMTKWLLALLLAVPVAARAEVACDHPRDDFDGLYCLNKVYQEADRELNENYKKLTGKLDADGKAKLKSGQLAWIDKRNAECSRRDGDGFFVNMRCATDETVARSRFLQDRLRECASTGCLNSKL